MPVFLQQTGTRLTCHTARPTAKAPAVVAAFSATYAAELKAADCAKWTMATYLPFLWRPDLHMFLKPVVTCDYASRVGHIFEHVYSSDLDYAVYDSLLDLISKTHKKLIDLKPQGNIDVQSFIWVVGAYSEDHTQEAPT